MRLNLQDGSNEMRPTCLLPPSSLVILNSIQDLIRRGWEILNQVQDDTSFCSEILPPDSLRGRPRLKESSLSKRFFRT